MPHELESEDLSAFLDRALPPERQEAAAAHLEGCAACRAELASLRGASARFRALGAKAAPPALKAALAQAASGAGAKRPGTSAKVYVLWLGGALAALLVLGKVFKPQISNAFNQIMGMVSGAAQGVASPN